MANITTILALSYSAASDDMTNIVADADSAPSSSSSVSNVCSLSSDLSSLPFSHWNLTLQPYWLLFFTSLFLTSISYFLNFLMYETKCGRRYVKWWNSLPCVISQEHALAAGSSGAGGSSAYNDEESQSSSARVTHHNRSLSSLASNGDTAPPTSLSAPPHLTDRALGELSYLLLEDPVVRWTLKPPTSCMTIQLVLQIAHIIYILCTLHSDQSPWKRYEELYARIWNGGASSLLLPFMFTRLHNQVHLHSKRWRDRASNYFMNLYIIFLLPSLITHGILVYVFLPLIFIITAIICFSWNPRLLTTILTRCGQHRLGMIGLIIGLNICITLCIQSAFNYGVMLYDGMNYFELMKLEYQMRDTKCYFQALTNPVQEMVVSFVSLF